MEKNLSSGSDRRHSIGAVVGAGASLLAGGCGEGSGRADDPPAGCPRDVDSLLDCRDAEIPIHWSLVTRYQAELGNECNEETRAAKDS